MMALVRRGLQISDDAKVPSPPAPPAHARAGTVRQGEARAARQVEGDSEDEAGPEAEEGPEAADEPSAEL